MTDVSISIKNVIGILIGIALNMWIAMVNIVIFTKLILPIHYHGMFSIHAKTSPTASSTVTHTLTPRFLPPPPQGT